MPTERERLQRPVEMSPTKTKLEELSEEMKGILENLSGMFTEATKKAEKIFTQLEDANQNLNDQKEVLEDSLTLQEQALNSIEDTPGGGKARAAGKPMLDFDLDGEEDGAEYGQEFATSASSTISGTLTKVTSGLLGGASAYQLFTNDMIAQEYLFAQGMTEIAYQTKSIASDAPLMQKAFRETSDVVKTTGFDLTTYQNTLMEAAKRGLKDTQSIVRTGLNLGRMMGMTEQEAAQISETFGTWSLHLGTDSLMIADISRGLQDVTRQTGLVGKNLMQVVKQTERFLKDMRNAGTLTASSAKNMMLLAAHAEKLGVAESMSDSMAGMSSLSNLLLKASGQTRVNLMIAAQHGGVLREMMQGTLADTRSGFKGMATGMESYFKRMSGVELTEEAIRNMDPTRRANLDLALQAQFGKGIEEYRREMEAFKKAGMSYVERIADIDKQMEKNITNEERLTFEREKQDLLMGKSFAFSTKLAIAAKDADNFNDAITNMQKQMSGQQWKELTQDLAAVAGTFSKDLQKGVLAGNKQAIAQSMALSAAEALNVKGKEVGAISKFFGGGVKDFTPEIETAIKTNDMEGLRTIQEEMNKEQQRIGVQDIEALDPIKQVAHWTKQINEYIRGTIGPVLYALVGFIGPIGIMVGMILASMAMSFLKVAYLGRLLKMFTGGKFAAMSGMGKVLTSAVGGLRSAIVGSYRFIAPFIVRGLKPIGRLLAWSTKAIGPIVKSIGPIIAHGFRQIIPLFLGLLRTIGPIITAAMRLGASLISSAVSFIAPIIAHGAIAIGKWLWPWIVAGFTKLLWPIITGIARFLAKVFLQFLWPAIRFLGGLLWRFLVRVALPFIIRGIVMAITALLTSVGLAIAGILVAVAGIAVVGYKAWEAAKEIGKLNEIEKKRVVTTGKMMDRQDKILAKRLSDPGETEIEKAEMLLSRQDKLKRAQYNLKQSVKAEKDISWMGSLLGAGAGARDRIKQDQIVLESAKKQLEEIRKQTGFLEVLNDSRGLRVRDANGIRLLEEIEEILDDTQKETVDEKIAPKAKKDLKEMPKVEPPKTKLPEHLIESSVKSHQMGLREAAIAHGGGGYKKMEQRRLSTIGFKDTAIENMADTPISIPLAPKPPTNAETIPLAPKPPTNATETTPLAPKPPTNATEVATVAGKERSLESYQRLFGKAKGAEIYQQKQGLLERAEQLNVKNGRGTFEQGVLQPESVVSPPIAQIPTGAEVEPTTPGIQPQPMVDVHDKIQREHAGTIATSKQKTGLDGALLAVSQNQLEYLILMHGDLEKVIGLLSLDSVSGESAMEAASTRTNAKPRNATDYHKWQFGRNQQLASTNIITDGVS